MPGRNNATRRQRESLRRRFRPARLRLLSIGEATGPSQLAQTNEEDPVLEVGYPYGGELTRTI
jgi:hypothetical protein